MKNCFAAYFYYSDVKMIPNNPLLKIMDTSSWNWVQFALSLPVVLCLDVFLCLCRKSVITWNLNMFTLIGIGSGVFYSACLAYFSRTFQTNSKLKAEHPVF
jgi:cation transport ATPase